MEDQKARSEIQETEPTAYTLGLQLLDWSIVLTQKIQDENAYRK